MTNAKTEFSKGISYIKREIQDLEQDIAFGKEYMDKIRKQYGMFSEETTRRTNKIIKEISEWEHELLMAHKALKHFMDEYSYSKSEVDAIEPATDEELAQDYEKDLKTTDYDTKEFKGSYTEQMHDEIMDRVHDKNLQEDLHNFEVWQTA